MNKTIKTIYIFIIFSLVFSGLFYSEQVQAVDISAVDVEVTGNKAVFTWQTDRMSVGCVKYGLSFEYENMICEVGAGYDHYVSVKGLLPNTVYHYKIVSKYGDEVDETFDGVFQTGTVFDEDGPRIFDIRYEYVGSNFVLIKFRTDEPAKAFIRYGTDGRMYSKNYSSYSRFVKDHEVILKRLKPNTTYLYKIQAVDRSRNRSETEIFRFTTKSQEEADDYAPLKIVSITPLSYKDDQIGYNDALISWTLNKPAQATIRFGTNSLRLSEKISIPGYKIQSEIRLRNLKPEQIYYYKLEMRDITGKRVKFPKSGYFSFKTLSRAKKKIVKGASISRVRFVKSLHSPYVYMLVNGKKHRLRTAEVMSSYGITIKDVDIVSAAELKYLDDVRLVKTPNSPTVYLLYPERGFRIPIPNPDIFESYPKNRWQDIVVITKEDLDSFTPAYLVKPEGIPVIYLLKDDIVYPFYTNEVLEYEGYNPEDAVEISQKHFEFFSQGPLIR